MQAPPPMGPEAERQAMGADIGVRWQALRAGFAAQAQRVQNPSLTVAQAPLRAEDFLALHQHYVRLGLPWHAHYTGMQALRMRPELQAQLRAMPPAAQHWGGDIWGESADTMLTRQAPQWPHLAAIEQVLTESLRRVSERDWLSCLYMLRVRAMLAPTDLEAQREWVKRAAALEPIVGETAHTLARWRLRAGDPAGAAQAALGAVKQAPQRFGSWLLRAESLLQLGQQIEAQDCFSQASLSPNPTFLSWLAEVMYRNNFAGEALQVRQQVVKLQPDVPEHWVALGRLQFTLWQQDAALQSVAKALSLQDGHADALQLQREIEGRTDSRQQFDQEWSRWKREGLRDNGVGSARLLMQSLYQDQVAAADVARLHLDVGRALEAQLQAPPAPPFAPDRNPKRRLRVGYVSGDFFRQHPVNVFMLPVLQHHDPEQVEVFVYYTGTMVDHYTHLAQQAAHHWRSVQAMGDLALRDMIRQDGIDVLVDLSGHTSSQRLGLFAMHAAPVQVAYLGYPHSTGLPCMDAMLVDAVVAPPEHASRFSERLLRLPGSVFCWAPIDDYPLADRVDPPLQEPVVFTSFNNLLKLSDRTVALWARVLQAVPDSALLLKAPVLADPAAQRLTRERFAAQGVDTARLMMRGPSELGRMMQEYGDAHIALDPTPYNGGTTSLQALWMGLPLVTLLGDNFVSRMGASFLSAMGQTDWIAQDEDAYVAIAQRLAQQWRTQGWSRPQQRAQMAASPVCDIVSHTQAMEAAYREAWNDWLVAHP